MTHEQIDGLLVQHERLIWWITKRTMGRYAQRHDLEDCAAEVRLQFLRAAHRFDPTRGVSFAVYAYRWAVAVARRWKRSQRRHGVHIPQYLGGQRGPRIIGLDALGHGNPLPDYRPMDPTPGDHPTTVWTVAARVLSSKQLELLRMRYHDGLSISAIAVQRGCSRMHVYRCLDLAFDRIRRLAPELAHYLE